MAWLLAHKREQGQKDDRKSGSPCSGFSIVIMSVLTRATSPMEDDGLAEVTDSPEV